MAGRALLAPLALAMGGLALAACQTDGSKRELPQGAVREGEPEPEARDPEPEPAGTFYEVQAGDTLWAIARAHDLPVEELVEVNGLESPDMLRVGQLIFIPDDDGLGIPHEPTEIRRTPPRREPARTGRLQWPLEEGVILRDFAPEAEVPYDGLLMAAPRGTPVLAAGEGDVLFVGDDGTTLGRMVIVRHEDGLLTIYAHLEEAAVQRGAHVAEGQIVGAVGTTGRVESPQLHFQVRRGRTPEDPLDHLPPP